MNTTVAPLVFQLLDINLSYFQVKE